jgi:thiol-disulfide isomerase/thioredoxin
MKKTSTVIVIVAALVAAVWYANRVTRQRVAHVRLAGDTPAVGPMAPEFTLKDLQGNDVSLSQLRGKVVLVNFWATWCEPCRDEIPLLIEVQQKYGAKGFVILGIALDDEGKKVVAPYVARERFDVHGNHEAMSYPILIGGDEIVQKFGGLLGYPTSVLISRDGRQIKRFTGRVGDQEINDAIQSLL